ncbi:uncharacterized protein H6S33_003607 [Morchella sextelata]|uniref:uncharacterized protein n=1 Tax=Morchella sextelata TaxID=1174677 RepID=UPI001D045D0B|nr:uncharacterized protein H6S33_003607 [Morchella sextelata]KAH0606773.1 hypothetical protein H6S33_003607 [Morchella sextelata]
MALPHCRLTGLRNLSRGRRSFTTTPSRLATQVKSVQQLPFPKIKSKWDEEPVSMYRRGGFHPTRLGDKIGDRYLVVRKLGWDVYYTVWLAKDLSTDRHVALKIIEDSCYSGKPEVLELSILKHIKTADPSHPGHSRILHMLDNFEHRGPNGNHVCMAFEPMGHDALVLSNKLEDYQLPVGAVQELARQLLQALDYLHTRCGVIHTNLKPRNILMDINDTEKVIRDYLLATQARGIQVQSRDSHLVRSEYIPTELPEYPNQFRFKLTGFIVSCWVDKHLVEWIQPAALRAPEVILGADWGPSVDLWNAACIFYELVTGDILFGGVALNVNEQQLDTPDAKEHHIAQMIALFGPLPEDLVREGRNRLDYLGPDGKMATSRVIMPRSLAGKIKEYRPDMTDEEVQTFESFLLKMLKYRPRDRKTAGEMLRDPWVQVPWE